jgi:hypothetical protein
MIGNAAFLKTTLIGPDLLTVRETMWGYVIRSTRPSGDLSVPLMRFASATVWVAVVGIWLLPAGMVSGPGFIWKAFASVSLIALLYISVAIFHKPSGYEVQVDLRRRELRMGMLTRRGDSWLRTSARFDEIGDSLVRRVSAQSPDRVLCMRVHGASEPVPVAIGDEATMMAVHDRLMRDMRPIEERVASSKLSQRPVRRVFPRLAPEEVVA